MNVYIPIMPSILSQHIPPIFILYIYIHKNSSSLLAFTNDKVFLILVHSGPSSLSPRGRDYRQTQGSPRVSEDARHGRTNGHRQRAGSATPSIQSTISSSGGGKDSPSRSITSKSSNSRNTPTSGKMITREDLRRMNRSTPSTKKERQPTSYSRTSIPMS